MLRCPWRRNEIDAQSMHPALILFGFGLRVDQPERVLQDQISRLRVCCRRRAFSRMMSLGDISKASEEVRKGTEYDTATHSVKTSLQS